jgi:ribosomal-protein-alanine N-acetyltransferase
LEIISVKGSETPLAAELIRLEQDTLGAGAFDHLTWPVLLDLGFVCACIYEGELIALTAFVRDWHEFDRAYLATLAVKKEWQCQGVGMFLLEKTFGMLKNDGITEVQLTVDPGNKAACGLYKKFGFIEIGFQRDKYGPGHDRLVLQWTISS